MLPINTIKQQLDETNDIIKKLINYQDRTINNLPDVIKTQLKKLPVYQNITSSGFEKVSSILTRLYVSQYYLEEAYQNPESFEKKYSQNSSPNSKNLSTPPKNSKKIDIIPQKPAEIPHSPSEEKPKITINLQDENASAATKKNNSPVPLEEKKTNITPPPKSNIDL